MDLYEFIPDSLCKKLHGLTINEALSKGLINDLGDEDGNFIFHSSHDPNILLAVVQHYKIVCSERLTQDYSKEEIENMAGNLSFFRFKNEDSFDCRLCRPNGIKLGRPLITLKLEHFVDDKELPNSIQFPLSDVSPNNPLPGTLYFDTKLKALRCFDGEKWHNC